MIEQTNRLEVNSMIRLGLAILIYCVVGIGQAMNVEEKHIFGYVEKIYIPELKATVKAKLDTGAKSSSLSAINIQESEEGNKIYLTFTVPLKSGPITVKAPLVGEVKIKSRAGEYTHGKTKPQPLHRPVINLTIKLNSQSHEIKVNLTNRKRFNYPLLLGREALIELGCIVDPSEAFLADKKEQK